MVLPGAHAYARNYVNIVIVIVLVLVLVPVIVNSSILSMNITIFINFSKFIVRLQVNSNSIMNVLSQGRKAIHLTRIDIHYLISMDEKATPERCLFIILSCP